MELQFYYLSSFKEKTYFLDSFSKIFFSSFNQKYSKQVFFWKYLRPQTEESIIQQIIVDKKIVGYRGLWKVKNYLDMYQCIDTCINPNFQGKGIFKLSNQNLISNFGTLFNYPNKRSKSGYLKSGWREISKMNIYLNKLENFEFCNWDKDFSNWRFVEHPFIKYYKTKTKHGYSILRFKKWFPIHVESILYNIDLHEIKNPIYSLKYDLKKNGLKVKSAGSILGYNFNEELRSSYFDMI